MEKKRRKQVVIFFPKRALHIDVKQTQTTTTNSNSKATVRYTFIRISLSINIWKGLNSLSTNDVSSGNAVQLLNESDVVFPTTEEQQSQWPSITGRASLLLTDV